MSDQTGSSSARVFGIVSVILGAITFGWQWIGGLCCGWLGWPLGIASIICALMTISGDKNDKILGAIGAFLSVIGVVIQLLIAGHMVGSLTR